MRAFLAQIDWVQNTFFFVFYFFMVLGVFIGIIQPSLESFRKSNAEYRKELYVQSQIESQRDAEAEKLLDYQKQNKQSLAYFDHKITQKEIEEKLKITFNNAGVVADGNPVLEDKYHKQRYVISGKLENIAKLKEALELTRILPGIARFNFPIYIERQGDGITFSFRLDVYFLAH